MPAKLIYYQSAQAPVEIPISQAVVTLGRQEGNTVMLGDDGVSRHHARLERSGADYVLADLNSTNGTFVNGVRLTGPQVLRDGDVVKIGGAMLHYRQTPSVIISQPQAAGQTRVDPVLRTPTPAPPARVVQRASRKFPVVPVVAGGIVLACLFVVCVAAAAYVVVNRPFEEGTATPISVARVIDPTMTPTLAPPAKGDATPAVPNTPVSGPTAAVQGTPTTKPAPGKETPTAKPVAVKDTPTTVAVKNTPTSSGPVAPTPAVISIGLAKDQDFSSSGGRYSLKIPSGGTLADKQPHFAVTYTGTGISFSIDYFSDINALKSDRERILNDWKQRPGVNLATERSAFVAGAGGLRSAAEYKDASGKPISHTMFALQDDNGLYYLIQALDYSSDVDRDQFVFQRMIGSLVFK